MISGARMAFCQRGDHRRRRFAGLLSIRLNPRVLKCGHAVVGANLHERVKTRINARHRNPELETDEVLFTQTKIKLSTRLPRMAGIYVGKPVYAIRIPLHQGKGLIVAGANVLRCRVFVVVSGLYRPH